MTGALTVHGPDQATSQALTVFDSGSSNYVLSCRDNKTVSVGAQSDPGAWAAFYVASGGFRCDNDFRLQKGSGSQYITRLTASGSSSQSGYDLVMQAHGDFTTNLAMNASPQADFHGTGSTILGAANSAVSSGNLNDGNVNVWVDESGNNLKFQVKYSTGTVKNGSVALS